MSRLVRRTLRSVLRRVLPRRWLLWQGPAALPAIALTFDDGPDLNYTAPVLDLLAREQVPATFFLIGDKITPESRPLVERLHRDGHEVANHRFGHKLLRDLTWRQFTAEMRQAEALVQTWRVPGARRLFRPPAGEVTLATLAYCWYQGLTVVLWSRESQDWRHQSVAAILANASCETVHNGEVLVFHDDNAFTVEALTQLIPALRRRGFRFVRVSELLG